MKIYFSKKFVRQANLLGKRNLKLSRKLEKRVVIFIKNPHNPLLKTHPLSGKLKDKWAFWISWDLRVVFEYLDKNSVRFLLLGRHDQVYK